MTDNFSLALNFVLTNEGGFVDDPDDAGGATNMGITLRTLRNWRGQAQVVTVDDVRNLTAEEAGQIYFNQYWVILRCDRILYWQTAAALFDAGVLFGISQTMMSAQKACQALGVNLKMDGIPGDTTLAAINSFAPLAFIHSFVFDLRRAISWIETRNPKDVKFDKGWNARINRYLSL